MILHLFLLLVVGTAVDGTHFQGGTISYKVVGNNASGVVVRVTQQYIYYYSRIYCNNTYIANQWSLSLAGYPDVSSTLTCIASCATSGGYSPIPVTPRCTDYSSGMDITVGQRSDDVILQNGSYFQIAFASSAWRNLSLPTGVTSKTWSVSTLIDLRVRDDGTWNTPPIATMISPIYIPAGVQQTISIPTIDADDDDVRCRFASGTNECGTVCPPASLPSGTSISTDCVLTITGATAGDWYAVAIQVEDFADSTSTTPYSSVPVQFLVHVYDEPTCTQRPYLYSEVPAGSCVGVQVGTPYTILLIVENHCSSEGVTMVDIATETFPIVLKSNIVQNTTTLWSVTLQWTPTADQVGSQIFCSVGVDSEDVQSNQYCLTFTVGDGTLGLCPGETSTTTTSTTTSLSTTSIASAENTTNQSTTVSTPTTVVVIVVPVVVVIISWCGCCCCCGCWCWSSKSKSTVEVEKKADKPAEAAVYTIQGPRPVLANSFSVVDFRQDQGRSKKEVPNMNTGLQSKNASQQTNRSSFLSTVHSSDADSKLWRKYPRWVYSVTPPSSTQRSRFTDTSVYTMARSERSLPLKPRYAFYDE